METLLWIAIIVIWTGFSILIITKFEGHSIKKLECKLKVYERALLFFLWPLSIFLVIFHGPLEGPEDW